MKITKLGSVRLCIAAGALTLVSAFTASPGAQKYSDWSEPINLGPLVNSTSMDRAPAISKDGLSLYFASNRPGGFGGEDIYVSQRATRDGEWGPAVNLGPTINTTATERVPAFSRDGHLMFFASDRIPGSFGGIFFNSNRPGSIANSQDLWVATTRETVLDPWSKPINLGSPLNTELVDVQPYISSDGETLFFASNRPGGGPTDLLREHAHKAVGEVAAAGCADSRRRLPDADDAVPQSRSL